VLYLKACQVLLQQCVAGYRVVDLGELKVRPSRNRAGVPLIIPAGVRVLISRDRDIPSIKLWMTLFGLYRILQFRGKLTLTTITDPGPNIESFIPIWEDFLEKSFKPQLLKMIKFPELSGPKIFPILKSGPTAMTLDDPPGTSYTNSSVRALVIAARVWLRKSPDNTLLEALKRFLPQIKDSSTFLSRLQTVAMVSNDRIDQFDFSKLSLGAVRYKPEPAGKVRVFAMVDAWTQWLLHPLHIWLFKILRAIPQDGTFDQMSPIKRLQNQYGSNPKGLFSSIDLSAATDRLPISLQVSVLKVLLKDLVPDSQQFAEAWRDLLVGRKYSVGLNPKFSKKSEFTIPGSIPDFVTYTVGQPMGALSSWAMLAITHHAMMQFSASQCGSNEWYQDYAVLGDDGVIKGTNQTLRYRQLLQLIGVKAGLAKSILSKNRFVIEFAKKFFVDTVTANMLPFKESIATRCSTSLIVEFIRKYDLSLNAILSFLGYGYKSKIKVYKTLFFKLPTRLRVLLVWFSHPSSPLGKSSYREWLLQKSWTEGFKPSDAAINAVSSILAKKNNEKFNSIYKDFISYIQDLEGTSKKLDSVTPIPIISMASLNGSDGATVTTNVPWNAVLSPELHSSDIDYDYLSAWNEGGMSNHGYRFEKLKDLKIGIDVWKLHDEFLMEMSNIRVPPVVNTMGELIVERADVLSLQCATYFALDDLRARVPEEFWKESRVSERPFRDFLSIYKYWQEATKPLWSEFYGKDLSLPVKAQRPKIERGDNIEGLVNHPSPSGSILNFPWVDFIVISVLTFLILEYLYGNSSSGYLVSPFLYDIISEETETNTLEISRVVNQTSVNWLAIGLLSAGALLLSGSIFLSYYHGHPWAWLGILEEEMTSTPDITIQTTGIQEIGDSVMAGNIMVSGPLSASSLSLVQIRLENQALLDNLAISPIGDLWISPW
jgi:hypothetical protein